MKKIGILYGQENTFPQAFVDRVNGLAPDDIRAELAHVEEVIQGEDSGYAVLIDRISQDVPFYRAYLKNAAISGTAVLNNPFWWSADEKFFNNALALNVDVPVPKTVLLPSHEHPDDTNTDSFRNLKYPLDWVDIIDYLGGFPLFMKPHSGGGWKHVYKVHNYDELWDAYHKTGKIVMMLQEAIDFDSYFRCYYLSGDRVHIMPYEPRNPHHLRYVRDSIHPHHSDEKMYERLRKYIITLNRSLGYDFNTVEFAIRDDVPYAIDFCNPAPDADADSVGEENFEWIVENAARMAIDRAQKHKDGQMNLTWGQFVTQAMKGKKVK